MRSFRVVKPLVGISCCTKQFGIFGMPNHAASNTYVEATDNIVNAVPILIPANGPAADVETLLQGIALADLRLPTVPGAAELGERPGPVGVLTACRGGVGRRPHRLCDPEIDSAGTPVGLRVHAFHQRAEDVDARSLALFRPGAHEYDVLRWARRSVFLTVASIVDA